MKLLHNLKRKLAQHAIELYTDWRHDFCGQDYLDHFTNLGSTLAKIDAYESLADLLKDIGDYKFDHLGLACDDSIENFFPEIYK
jgi:hypothetical protein